MSTARRISRDPHLGAADQHRYVGKVGIAVADETCRIFGRINGRPKDEATDRGITKRIDGLDVDTAASLATGQANQAGVGHKPGILKLDHISTREREAELFGQLPEGLDPCSVDVGVKLLDQGSGVAYQPEIVLVEILSRHEHLFDIDEYLSTIALRLGACDK